MLNLEPGEVAPEVAADHEKDVAKAAEAIDAMSKAARAARAILAGGQYLKGNNKGRFTKANSIIKRARNPHHNLTPHQLMEALQTLHPILDAPEDIPWLPEDAPLCVAVDPDVVAKALQYLSSGSCPGPTGWTAELLQAIWPDSNCREAICLLVKHIINGNVNEEARAVLLSSILIAVGKKRGGVRPIAMGETLYKLAVRCAMYTSSAEIETIFAKVQMALGTLGGGEKAIHGRRAALERKGIQ